MKKLLEIKRTPYDMNAVSATGCGGAGCGSGCGGGCGGGGGPCGGGSGCNGGGGGGCGGGGK